MRWADNVVEESTTTTTGAYQLGGVPASGEAPGAQTFVAGIGDAQTCYYYAKEVSGTAWERGIGTVTDAATDTLARTTIHGSSNAGSAVDWTGKTLRVYCVNPAYALRRSTLDHAGLLENVTISTSRTGNAETISLKAAAGNDPSAADPGRIGFRDVTAGTGTFSVLDITASASITISSGSTLGATSATIFRLWLVAFNDAGTFRLGVIKCALTDGVYGLQDNVLESSTAEGGAGAADSSGVIYTGTAVTSKAMRVLGYLEYTLTTAGTWDAAPSLIHIYSQGDRLPGETVQIRRKQTGEVASGTTLIPLDDTIPQNTEGDEYMAQMITPKSSANLLMITHSSQYTLNSSGTLIVALFQDSVANAIASSFSTIGGANYAMGVSLVRSKISGATAPTEFKIRAGPNVARTVTFNGSAGSRVFGGSLDSFLQIAEVMV
jgi:hypothetical protein